MFFSFLFVSFPVVVWWEGKGTPEPRSLGQCLAPVPQRRSVLKAIQNTTAEGR